MNVILSGEFALAEGDEAVEVLVLLQWLGEEQDSLPRSFFDIEIDRHELVLCIDGKSTGDFCVRSDAFAVKIHFNLIIAVFARDGTQCECVLVIVYIVCLNLIFLDNRLVENADGVIIIHRCGELHIHQVVHLAFGIAQRIDVLQVECLTAHAEAELQGLRSRDIQHIGHFEMAYILLCIVDFVVLVGHR